jgi:hypothetical protein
MSTSTPRSAAVGGALSDTKSRCSEGFRGFKGFWGGLALHLTIRLPPAASHVRTRFGYERPPDSGGSRQGSGYNNGL